MSTSAAAPSEIEEELAAVTVPSLPNAGFSAGILLMSQVPGVSSRATTVSPLRVFTVTGVISASNSPASTARSARRTDSVAKASCCGAREAVLRRRGVGEAAHELAIERALQAVVEHVIEHLAVPHAIAAARLGQQVRRVGHRLEAAGEHDLRRRRRGSGPPPIITAFRPEPHILLSVVAGTLDGHAGADGRLACGRLAEACGQHAAHDHFLDVAGFEAGGLDGRLDRRAPSCGAVSGRERALERTDGRALGGQR